MFFPGLTDTPDTTRHIMDAILLRPYQTSLHYIDPEQDRGWLQTTPACKNNYGRAKQTRKTCDEYPFATTAEGGEGEADARLVPTWEQTYQGGILSAFYRLCQVKPNDPIKSTFFVVPWGGLNIWVCE